MGLPVAGHRPWSVDGPQVFFSMKTDVFSMKHDNFIVKKRFSIHVFQYKIPDSRFPSWPLARKENARAGL